MESNATTKTEQGKMNNWKWNYEVNVTKMGWSVTRSHTWSDGRIAEVAWGEYGSYAEAKAVADKENA